MSVWTSIEGTFIIPKKEKVSLKKVFDTQTPEHTIKIKTKEKGLNYEHEVCGSICLDYLEIYDFFKTFKKETKSLRVDLDINSRLYL